MIKKFKYECDGGSIMLGNETSCVCIPNGYGDGEFTVEVRDYESRDYKYTRDMEWHGAVSGDNIHIYNYDCLRGDDLTDSNNILYTLPEGRYGVYTSDGYVVLEQWIG